MTGVTLIPSSGNTDDIAQKPAAVTVRNQVVVSRRPANWWNGSTTCP